MEKSLVIFKVGLRLRSGSIILQHSPSTRFLQYSLSERNRELKGYSIV